jgi:hypothetical protein
MALPYPFVPTFDVMQTRSIIAVISLTALFSLAKAQDTVPLETITSHIPRQRVDSSAISEIGYSKRRHWLELKFVSGGTYRYLDVPPSVYRELIAGESKAGYYAPYIRSNYRSVRVRPRVKDEDAH